LRIDASGLFFVELTQEQIFRLNETMFPELPQGRTNVALVLGFGPLSGYLADAAARLYHEGWFERIVVSGGVAVEAAPMAQALLPLAVQEGQPFPKKSETESRYIQRILLNKGVPEDRIDIENKAQNSGQNMEFSKPFVPEGSSIMLVVCASTVPRALATARRFWTQEEAILTAYPVFPLGITKKNWAQNPFASQFVFDESVKMKAYTEKGHCVPVDWPSECALAATLPPTQVRRSAPKLMGQGPETK